MTVLTILVFALSFVLQCNANVNQVRADLVKRVAAIRVVRSTQPSSVCSLVCSCFQDAGYKLPEEVSEQFLYSKPIRFGKNLKPGDFAFFSQPTPDDLSITESMIYIGSNVFVKLEGCACVDVSRKNAQEIFGCSVDSIDHSQLVLGGSKKDSFVFFGSYFDVAKATLPDDLLEASYKPTKESIFEQQHLSKPNDFDDKDFVEITGINAAIRYELYYATRHNLANDTIYKSAKCYARYALAKKLDLVQQELEKRGLGLKITDCYRPRSAQVILFNACPVPGLVANPKKGSKHNRGAAVDVTLVCLSDGQELDMGSPVDEMSERSFRNYTASLTKEHIANRKLLEDVMVKHGFNALPTEWWHFDLQNWRDFPLEDKTFEELATL
jgi:D-alanyl-D-alanine dipeptidase